MFKRIAAVGALAALATLGVAGVASATATPDPEPPGAVGDLAGEAHGLVDSTTKSATGILNNVDGTTGTVLGGGAATDTARAATPTLGSYGDFAAFMGTTIQAVDYGVQSVTTVAEAAVTASVKDANLSWTSLLPSTH